MDRILVNPGISFIGCQIFSLLNINHLKQCRLVCHLWNEFLVNHKFFWAIFYASLGSHRKLKRLIRCHPEWESVCLHFQRCQSITESKLFLKIMHRYFEKGDNQMMTTPFHLAASSGEIEEVQLLLPHLNHLGQDDAPCAIGFLSGQIV